MPKALSDAEKIQRHVSPEPNSGCWLWSGYVNRHGYGVSSGMLAHRRAWRMMSGDAGDLHVLHKCDNRCCVNPDHLFLGTNLDNINDRKAKGRRCSWPGERNARAKLTIAAVRHIRRRELLVKEYAALYGVGQSTISMVLNGSNWEDAE